jgi:hypothetical protein
MNLTLIALRSLCAQLEKVGYQLNALPGDTRQLRDTHARVLALVEELTTQLSAHLMNKQ